MDTKLAGTRHKRSPYLLVVVLVALVAALAGATERPSGPRAAWAQPAVTAPAADHTRANAPAHDDEQDVTSDERSSDRGGRNIVTVVNRTDNRLRMRGNIQLSRSLGSTAEPVNFAGAYSSCTDCQTIAVALQIALISTHATVIAPRNSAVAINFSCTRCVSVARAIQYVVQVDDPHEVPNDVSELMREMNRELRSIASDRSVTLAQAEARIEAVISRFHVAASSLYEQRDEKDN